MDELDAEKRRESGQQTMDDIPVTGDILENDKSLDLGGLPQVEKVSG
jgi:hypothetical protein